MADYNYNPYLALTSLVWDEWALKFAMIDNAASLRRTVIDDRYDRRKLKRPARGKSAPPKPAAKVMDTILMGWATRITARLGRSYKRQAAISHTLLPVACVGPSGADDPNTYRNALECVDRSAREMATAMLAFRRCVDSRSLRSSLMEPL